MQQSEITKLFKSLRQKKISKSDLYKILMSISINTEKTYLIFLKEDLELYIRGEWKKIVDSLKIKQIQKKIDNYTCLPFIIYM